MKVRAGNSDEALDAPGADARELITGLALATQLAVFYCLSIWVYNSHVADDAVVGIYDQDEGVAVAASQRFTLLCPAGVTTQVTFPEPGIPYFVNITAATTGGTVAAYECGASGYTEGGS